ncbi:sodium:calcium antiporter [Kineococcus sp. SYSU DK004]|uniref:sodium:calcium antiporter n=1 Tax=Kineococcus sp. SYSU DK004 TaxID=3383125 RepID=UPI003D7D322C
MSITDLSAPWPLVPSLVGLVVAGVVIVVTGTRITAVADEIADRTGAGEALAGAVLLGATTSLPGLVTVAVGGLSGDAEFAFANTIGGILIQTVWLSIADLVYRRVNLEHAAASSQNLMQALVLIGLLTVPVIGFATPELSWLGVHPATFAIPVLYAGGLVLVRRQGEKPMWRAVKTDETVEDVPQEGSGASGRRLGASFALLAAAMAVAGYVVGRSGLGVVEATGLSGGLVGSTLTTGVSSMPELVTLIAAVRMKSLALGVGDIIGGNVFDALQITVADVFYRQGPIYADAGDSGLLLLGAGLLVSALLASALLLRDRRGIGFEGIAIPVVWVAAVVGVSFL